MRSPSDTYRPLVIGLAGGIGSGKSAVAGEFEARGWLVIDFDAEVARLLKTEEAAAEISSWWGERVLGPGGSLNRKAIAEIVFEDPQARQRLEAFVHPRVWVTGEEAAERARREGAAGIVLDAPVLFESGLDAECDAVVFVEAPADERRRRVTENRGWSRQEWQRREAAQLGVDQKRARSDYVLHNDAEPGALPERVAELCAKMQRDLESPGGETPAGRPA